jgi:two-component system OmpR family sensor kinase
VRGTLRSSIARAIVFASLFAGVVTGAIAITVRHLNATDMIVIGTIVCLQLLVSAVALVAARRQTAALERLAATTTTFAAGDLDVRARTDGPREVRLIAESFNRMAGEVSEALTAVTAEEQRKTQFVSDVSHELRTPLTAIRGAAETLLDGDVAPDDQERFLSTIAAEAERLTRLANDLLALQRIEGATGELPLHRVNLREAADRAAAMLEPLIEARSIELQVSGTAPLVLGDLDRLQQVVANLVDNASRIVGEGGHVLVELGEEDGFAVLAVADDGPGIDEADLPRLFDRFYRADTSRTRSKGGAGLGLAIVRAIVTAHGGTIEAENLQPTGARLTVRLPALPQ